ncbi:MAG: hypothetical protein KDD44_01460, partial [Bdellovibrionales bacterium]|nr:hypothetical protein [Bdellovibrionales bacterium]
MKAPHKGLAIGLLAVVATLSLFFYGSRELAAVQPRAEREARLEAVATRLQTIRPAENMSDRRVVAAESPEAIDTVETCTVPVVAGFWQYVSDLRRLEDSTARKAELDRSATVLRKLDVEELHRIGVSTPEAIRTGAVGNFGPGGARITVKTALPECWVRCADAREEPLRAAVLRYFDEEAAGLYLNEADPVLLEFGSWFFLFHYNSEEDIAVIAPRLLSTLMPLPAETKPDLALPPMKVMCEYARVTPELRMSVLDLLAQPWCEPYAVLYWVMLTRGTTYPEWAGPIAELLASDKPRSQWGALEALRNFAGDKASGLDAAGLLAAVPDALYRHEQQTIRWAVYEMIAKFGDVFGEQRLRQEIDDASNPYRSDALSFLASAGRLSGPDCIAYAEDPGLQDAAIFALGDLARAGDQEFRYLRGLVSGTDQNLRLLALRALGESGRLTP